MAKSAGPKINSATVYRVDLTHSIQVGRAAVHPGPNVKLRGDVLQKLIENDAAAVAGFEPFEKSKP